MMEEPLAAATLGDVFAALDRLQAACDVEDAEIKYEVKLTLPPEGVAALHDVINMLRPLTPRDFADAMSFEGDVIEWQAKLALTGLGPILASAIRSWRDALPEDQPVSLSSLEVLQRLVGG